MSSLTKWHIFLTNTKVWYSEGAFQWSQWYRLGQVGQSLVWRLLVILLSRYCNSFRFCANILLQRNKYKLEIDNKYIQPATIRGNKSEAEFGKTSKICANDEVEVGGNDIQKGVRQTKSDSCQHLMDWIAIGKSSSNCFETKAEIETLWRPKGRN